jgi:hypothetical protein
MSFEYSYRLLFEVTVFHNFFLNDGESDFGIMLNKEKQKMLLKYDFENFITISPSIATQKTLKNFKMQFKKTKTGFRIFIKVKQLEKSDPLFNLDPFIEVPTDLELIFTMKINDCQFENYTDLSFSPNQLFYFGNAIPLRIEHNEPIPDPNPIKEVFNPEGFNYIPLLASNTLISNNFLASKDESNNLFPDFETAESRGLFGVISIAMTGHDEASSILTNQNKIIATTKEFLIHFNNRKTIWKYINRKDSTTVETNSAKPLTYSGFVEIDPLTDFTPAEPEQNQYPNPSVKSIVKINSDYYSEIFI